MDEQDILKLNEQEFETLLQESMSPLPPEDIVHAVTPWRKASNRILTGFALGAITLNFWGLNYLLPAIGLVLTLLGFRTLRKENGWFRACWIFTILRCAWHFPALMLNTTIYQDTFYRSDLASMLNIVNATLQLLLYFSLWQALRAVKEKAGLEPHAGGAVGLILWNGFVCVWGLLQIPANLILAILLLVVYVCIIRSLVKLSRQLDEAGYTIHVAPVMVPNKVLVAVLAAVLLAGGACGYLFFHQYPMQWQPVTQAETDETIAIKARLISLGFPAHILEDLTGEDLLACENALQVVVDVTDFPVNGGRHVWEEDASGMLHGYTVYDQKELRITGIAVLLPGEQDRWKIIHHFQWTIDPNFYGTEVIQLWPAYQNSKGWTSDRMITGQVLYNLGEQTYAAAYYELGTETFTTDTIFWGEQTSTDVFAAFSMPKHGENHRGYVSYVIDEAQEGWIINAWINYTHQNSWLQYPVVTAKQKHLTVGVKSSGVFMTIQDALQFFPDQEEGEN